MNKAEQDLMDYVRKGLRKTSKISGEAFVRYSDWLKDAGFSHPDEANREKAFGNLEFILEVSKDIVNSKDYVKVVSKIFKPTFKLKNLETLYRQATMKSKKKQEKKSLKFGGFSELESKKKKAQKGPKKTVDFKFDFSEDNEEEIEADQNPENDDEGVEDVKYSVIERFNQPIFGDEHYNTTAAHLMKNHRPICHYMNNLDAVNAFASTTNSIYGPQGFDELVDGLKDRLTFFFPPVEEDKPQLHMPPTLYIKLLIRAVLEGEDMEETKRSFEASMTSEEDETAFASAFTNLKF